MTGAVAGGLRGMTWDHPRGYGPLRAFQDSGRSPVEVAWDAQPLAAFEAHPLDQLARDYDLLVLDHPGLGAGIARNALLPLEDLFPAEELVRWSDEVVPPSWSSYTLAGRQWAVPIDAATQVSVYRRDRLDRVPSGWRGVADAVRGVPSALCLAAPHALLTLLALCGPPPPDGRLLDDSRAAAVLHFLQRLWPGLDREVSALNPIGVHEALAVGVIGYCPLVYGYAAYSRPDTASAARAPLAFADAPGWDGSTPASVLGGTGLAIANRPGGVPDDRRAEIRSYLRAFLRPEVQLDLVPEHAGQPACSAVWQPGPVDERWGNYYTSTVASVRSALIRPRHDGWIAVQHEGSLLVEENLLTRGDATRTVAEINRLCAASWKDAA